ncbi:MAG: pilus assembly protein [Sulfuriferula sp.]|nr:pilus assembly protein [Sulfuriferula sp.]
MSLVRADLLPQRGAVAIEFALVFPIFFVLMYGIVTYSVIFLAQQSITLAAEEGARAALRYAPTTDERNTTACSVAALSLTWLGAGNVTCNAQAGSVATNGSYPIKVTLSYPYQAKPLVPLLLGSLMNVAVPTTLASSATVFID